MNLSGDIVVPAPREAVFAALQNAPFFASCVDGVRDLTEIDPLHYDAVLETKVAYMKFKFKVSVEVTRISPPDVIEAKVEGTPLGVVGRFTATSVTRLSEESGQTRVSYTIEANLTGKLGSIGQPVVKSKAREMEKKFAEAIRTKFAQGAAPAAATVAPAPGTGGTP
jgi:carbon monoxide dehydrogenase subunit G